jgi:hypothetical protein
MQARSTPYADFSPFDAVFGLTLTVCSERILRETSARLSARRRVYAGAAARRAQPAQNAENRAAAPA